MRSILTFGQDVTEEYVEDEAVEDNLFQENGIDVFPGEISENWEQFFLTRLFLTSIPSETSWEVLFQPFD